MSKIRTADWAWVLVGILVGGGLLAEAEETSALKIPVCEKPPVLDGALDADFLQSAEKIEHLYKPGDTAPLSDTRLWLARDDQWLYIVAQCHNPRMVHVEKTVFDHDGPVQEDDSLEIFLRPSSDAKAPYYHFLVNFAGVVKEQQCYAGGARNIAWDTPWRAITKKTAEGWTAEIAIPWAGLGVRDLSELSVNFCRNFINVELDAYGAVGNRTREARVVKAGSTAGFHDFANFVPISGLAGFKPQAAFAPCIHSAALDGFCQKDGRYFYTLKCLLTPWAKRGAAKLQIKEIFGDEEKTALEQTVEINGKTELELQVPLDDFQERKIKLVLINPDNGGFLAARDIADTSAISVIRNAYIGRNYYTQEEAADLHLQFGLPTELLKEAGLEISAGGEVLVQQSGLQPEMSILVALDKFALGETGMVLRIKLAGKSLAERALKIVKLVPGKNEVKADFARGVLLKNGQPLFPVGIVGHGLQKRLDVRGCTDDDEELFRFLAEDVGFDTLVRSVSATNTVVYMNLAKKYGLDVITWTSPQPLPPGMKPGQWPPPPVTMPLEERLQYQRQRYIKEEPALIADTKILREYDNFIGYWNIDEPNLVNPEERILVAELYYKTVWTIDPYRPQFLLYARHIPADKNWTRWGDILGFDVYPWVYYRTNDSEPGLSTAYYACLLRERCRRDCKLMWFVPLANMLDPARTPVGMSKTHMLCQAYAAIIYGARGLLYFAFNDVAGRDAWDALRTICRQIKEIKPALVNGDLPQQIQYVGEEFNPRGWKFPMVNAAAFRYPDGAYLLLAVNIRPHAAETSFRITGLRNAKRLFVETPAERSWLQRLLSDDPSHIPVAASGFTDKFAPYGVHAYRLELENTQPQVELALQTRAIPEETAPQVDLPGIVERLRAGKNYMPNPCFEVQTNPDVPDFYRPFFCLSVDPYWGEKGKSDWFVDDTERWNNRASLRMFRRPFVAGGRKTRGLFGVFYPPLSEGPMRLTFSFYAKAASPNASLWMRIEQTGATFTINLTQDWQRHHITFELPAVKTMCLGAQTFLVVPSENAVIHISGLQVEKGEQPTDFQDDFGSIVKQSIVAVHP